MRAEIFSLVRQEFDDVENKLLGVKRSEYAGDEDVLINFREVAEINHMTPEKYCSVLLSKHFHAILRAVDKGEYKWCWADEFGEGLKQRIADTRNFLILLAALIAEKAEPERLSITIIEEDSGSP